MIGLIIVIVLVLWVAVLFIRASLYKPYSEPERIKDNISADRDRIVKNMSDMIRCKTISFGEAGKTDYSEFERFQKLLEERYPLIHKHSELSKHGKTGLLYCLKGRSSQKPSVCMAHYDVVPIEEAGWIKPAFEGIVEDGYIWGRGTLDTKGTLLGIIEATEQLLKDGFVPENDLYLSFSGDEEINGSSCVAIVDYLRQKGISPAFVLDEGGAVVEKVFPGVTKPCALIGIGEKVGVNLELSIDSQGGHASTPPVHTILGQLSQAVVNIEKNPVKAQYTKPVREMFDTLGRHAPFGYKIVFANMWCFLPLLKMVTKKLGGELNAMMRTTFAVTKMEGSKAFNVLPPTAKAGINARLLGSDTVDGIVSYLNRVIKNDNVKVSVYSAMEASGYSDTSCEEWKKLQQVIHTTWPEAIVAPYLMMACSDSRHYAKISNNIYKFSAMVLSKEERGMIHGNNERVPIDTLVKTVEFYIRLIGRL